MIWGGIYPGMITATIGTVLLIAVVVSLGRRSCAAGCATSGGTPSTSRPTRRSRSPGSTRSRPATSSCSTASPPTTGARSTSRRSRSLVVFRVGVPLAQRVPLPAAGRRGRRRRARASSRCASPAAASTGCRRAAGPVLPLALPRAAAAGGRRIRSRSPPRPTGDSLRITVKALGDFTGRDRRDPRPARASSPRGRSASSPTTSRRREKVAADRRRHRHHADPRPARGDGRRRRRRSTASSRDDDVIFRDELEALARERGVDAALRRRRPRDRRGPRSALARRTSGSSSRTSPSARSTSAGRPR